jgi:glutathione S-transferase
MEWNNTTFWPAIRPLFMGLVRTPPEKRDPHALEESRLSTAKMVEIFDAHLASHEFVAGDTFSLGDIPMGCAIWRWMSLPIERPVFANLQRWFGTLRERPAYQRVVMLPLT